MASDHNVQKMTVFIELEEKDKIKTLVNVFAKLSKRSTIDNSA